MNVWDLPGRSQPPSCSMSPLFNGSGQVAELLHPLNVFLLGFMLLGFGLRLLLLRWTSRCCLALTAL